MSISVVQPWNQQWSRPCRLCGDLAFNVVVKPNGTLDLSELPTDQKKGLQRTWSNLVFSHPQSQNLQRDMPWSMMLHILFKHVKDMSSFTGQLFCAVAAKVELLLLEGGLVKRPDAVVEAGADNQMEMLYAYNKACVEASRACNVPSAFFFSFLSGT